MGLGIRLAGPAEPVIAAFRAMPAAIFVARVVGRCDVLATVRAFSAAQLVDVVDEIRGLPGVTAVESWVHLDVVKENYASGFPE